jgi:hypothetical protein
MFSYGPRPFMLRFELYQEVKVTEQVGSEICFTTASNYVVV